AATDLTIESQLIMRQNENNNAAIQYCLARNITWLMHIDIDEIFYEDGDHSWTTWENVGSIIFVNYESVPLRHDVTNPFVDCTLFKVRGGELPFMAYGNGKPAVRLSSRVHSNGPHQFAGYEGEHRSISKPFVLHYATPSYE